LCKTVLSPSVQIDDYRYSDTITSCLSSPSRRINAHSERQQNKTETAEHSLNHQAGKETRSTAQTSARYTCVRSTRKGFPSRKFINARNFSILLESEEALERYLQKRPRINK
jgi:hypothetical protein